MQVKEHVLFTTDTDPCKYAALIRRPQEQVIPMPGFFKQNGVAVGRFCKMFNRVTKQFTFVVSTTNHPLLVAGW